MDIKILPKGAASSGSPGTVSSLEKFYISDTDVSSGEDLLAQLVLKTMLTKRGSIITNPRRGSTLASLAGNFNVMDAADAVVRLHQEVKDVEQQVIEMQSRSSKYRPRERLQKISVSSAVPGESSIVISMAIINELNKVSLLKVSV
jgi:hypothetical protein